MFNEKTAQTPDVEDQSLREGLRLQKVTQHTGTRWMMHPPASNRASSEITLEKSLLFPLHSEIKFQPALQICI